MNVSDLLENKFGAHPDHVVDCAANDFVHQAIEKMFKHKIGALVITEGDKVSGVFSERDIVRLAHADPTGFRELKLCDVMTKNVISVAPQQPVEEALEAMKTHGIRHLTVMQGDKLVGFLSLRDLMVYKIAYAEQAADFMKGQILGQSDPLPM